MAGASGKHHPKQAKPLSAGKERKQIHGRADDVQKTVEHAVAGVAGMFDGPPRVRRVREDAKSRAVQSFRDQRGVQEGWLMGFFPSSAVMPMS